MQKLSKGSFLTLNWARIAYVVETLNMQKKRFLASIFASLCCHFFPHSVTWIGSEGFSESDLFERCGRALEFNFSCEVGQAWFVSSSYSLCDTN